jgi:hypothetical protein
VVGEDVSVTPSNSTEPAAAVVGAPPAEATAQDSNPSETAQSSKTSSQAPGPVRRKRPRGAASSERTAAKKPLLSSTSPSPKPDSPEAAPVEDHQIIAPSKEASVTVVQEAPSVAVVQEAPSVAVVQEARSVAVVQEAPSVTVAQEAPSVAVAQEAPSVAVAQEAPSVTVVEERELTEGGAGLAVVRPSWFVDRASLRPAWESGSVSPAMCGLSMQARRVVESGRWVGPQVSAWTIVHDAPDLDRTACLRDKQGAGPSQSAKHLCDLLPLPAVQRALQTGSTPGPKASLIESARALLQAAKDERASAIQLQHETVRALRRAAKRSRDYDDGDTEPKRAK